MQSWSPSRVGLLCYVRVRKCGGEPSSAATVRQKRKKLFAHNNERPVDPSRSCMEEHCNINCSRVQYIERQLFNDKVKGKRGMGTLGSFKKKSLHSFSLSCILQSSNWEANWRPKQSRQRSVAFYSFAKRVAPCMAIAYFKFPRTINFPLANASLASVPPCKMRTRSSVPAEMTQSALTLPLPLKKFGFPGCVRSSVYAVAGA